MEHEFDETTKAHISRDAQGVTRDILLAEEPYQTKASTPQLGAREFLEKFGGLLGISLEQLSRSEAAPESQPIDAKSEFRFIDEKIQFQTTTVAFSQTYFGLPIWEAGLAVHFAHEPLRVISANSTRHADVDIKKPSPRNVKRLEELDKKELAARLGLVEKHKTLILNSLKIEKIRLVVYRYESAKRELPKEESTSGEDHDILSLPLPPTSKDIHEGRHYVAAEAIFELGTRTMPGLRWLAIIEAETLSILLLRPFVAPVNGLVFMADPVTTNGGPLPNAGNAGLNPLRTTVLLKGLVPPGGGNYALSGDLVQLSDVEPPAVAAPTEPVGTDFNFNVRTDNFSAVNAYYHCDRFFRLVEDLGFNIKAYFGGTSFPSIVDHRGSITTPTGNEINAHCVGNGAFGILRTTFMLADLTNVANPVGLADDWRVVLHELAGHGILYNHINVYYFAFSHSAGDSFAAVLSDPESRAPDRGVTFPWVNIIVGRRHDRSVAAGWGWGGVNDTGFPANNGYQSEQVLSTTHFRIYRSIGGDSTEVAMKKFAARYVAYLILRLVGAMTPATQPPNATAYASQLMTADLGNWTSEGQVGGAYWKVIRWAFEQQGLYQPPGAPVPVTTIGAPPPVDIYIDDGRNGEYQYGPASQFPYLQRFWETTDIWNRHKGDGNPVHQTPILERTNYAYVRVKNRGTTPATGVWVHAHHCRPTAGLVWPDDLKPMRTVRLPVTGNIPPGGQVVVGPFEWEPECSGHECMFMSVSAVGDRANNDPATMLPTASGPTPLWRMVPCDNNQALRALIPVPGGGHRRALVAAFRRRHFWAKNPFARPAKVGVRFELPSFLVTRGWGWHLANPGGTSFSLGPYDERIIQPRLVGGQDFTASEVTAIGQVTIRLFVLVDGIVVGGLTYLLDPELKHPAVEELDDERDERAETESEEKHHEKDRAETIEKLEKRRLKLEIDLD